MKFHLKKVYFDDGSEEFVNLTFANIDAVLDWVILLSNQNDKKRHWYKFTLSVSPTSF